MGCTTCRRYRRICRKPVSGLRKVAIFLWTVYSLRQVLSHFSHNCHCCGNSLLAPDRHCMVHIWWAACQYIPWNCWKHSDRKRLRASRCRRDSALCAGSFLATDCRSHTYIHCLAECLRLFGLCQGCWWHTGNRPRMRFQNWERNGDWYVWTGMCHHTFAHLCHSPPSRIRHRHINWFFESESYSITSLRQMHCGSGHNNRSCRNSADGLCCRPRWFQTWPYAFGLYVSANTRWHDSHKRFHAHVWLFR